MEFRAPGSFSQGLSQAGFTHLHGDAAAAVLENADAVVQICDAHEASPPIGSGSVAPNARSSPPSISARTNTGIFSVSPCT